MDDGGQDSKPCDHCDRGPYQTCRRDGPCVHGRPPYKSGRVCVIYDTIPTPQVDRHRLVWQMIVGKDGQKTMQLAPLDWLPSGAHEAIANLLLEIDNLRLDRTTGMAPYPNHERPRSDADMTDLANYLNDPGRPRIGGYMPQHCRFSIYADAGGYAMNYAPFVPAQKDHADT